MGELTNLDRAWLRSLNTAIWQERHDVYCGQSRTWWMETRKVTSAELKRALRLALLTVVEPINACMGFNFGINLYDPGSTEELEMRRAVKAHGGRPPAPAHLLSLTGHHLDTRFAETWERLSPLSHNEKNAALLAEFGFEPLQDKAHYDY